MTNLEGSSGPAIKCVIDDSGVYYSRVSDWQWEEIENEEDKFKYEYVRVRECAKK